MDDKKKSFGTVTVGAGTAQSREIEIREFIQCAYKDRRLVTVSKLEDDTFVLVVENPESTGRHTTNKMWLSQESFIGLLASSMLYLKQTGLDLDKLVKDTLDTEQIHFSCSPNLSPKK